MPIRKGHERASAKQSMGGPSAKERPLRPRRGLVERAATALGAGTRSDDADVRNLATADRLASKIAATEAMVAAVPENPNKPAEYARDGEVPTPPEGVAIRPENLDATASTISEDNASRKTGEKATPSRNANITPLHEHRVDSLGRMLTTNQGVAIADNQSSLRAGLRGPTLLEDFVLREKITHFDHERIPERVVHARGSGAHGYFECTDDITSLTKAAPFRAVGKRTPVFVRFSTVAGERGSADTVRDVRGFAVKLYTDDGNWDIVGNNIPVFFIQDAMKFPDLAHAVKPEPHHGMPQASSAHDTFWDFISLMPESMHMILWHMSDRAIPRSFRMMQGFGVHTFRLVNEAGRATLVKFHWTPVLGTHSLDWDEAVKIAGADADFHRRDLWEAIEGGAFPEYLLQIQTFTEEQAASWSFDVLDSTKIVPEELAPLRTVGRLVLDRNPDYFFGETEQVAFCTQNIVPGIDFTNDPLLQGRNFSYLDTQLSRLGGPNFQEIPINQPLAEVHNNQRDGFHQHAVFRGRVAYEPSSLGGGCPFQAGLRGFRSVGEKLLAAQARTEPSKLRAKPEKFADHYTQARLFWASQTPTEQAHIVRAFRFELTRVQTVAVRERMLRMLRNVDEELAASVAAGLGMPLPEPMPYAAPPVKKPEVKRSPGLSLEARPGNGRVLGRRVALLVADGVEAKGMRAIYDALLLAGAVPRWVGARLGTVRTTDGDEIPVEVTMETAPSVLFDAVVLPAGGRAAAALALDDLAKEFVTLQFRHCKPLLVPRSGAALLAAANVAEDVADPGLLFASDTELAKTSTSFIRALGRHRVWTRQLARPEVPARATPPRPRTGRPMRTPAPGGTTLRGRGRLPSRRPSR